VLRILTDPPGNRLTRALIVAAYIVGLGIIDYFTGTTLSLQVFYLAPIALALAWLGFPAERLSRHSPAAACRFANTSGYATTA
jgi:polyferredoxin